MREEMGNLDWISENAPHTEGVMVSATEYCWSIFRRYIQGPDVLELGPAEGVMTELMVREGFVVTCVEGSPRASHALESRLPSVEVLTDLFEQFEASKPFDSIVLGHVLEHVAMPGQLLQRLKPWLRGNDSLILASVPNAMSLHRQAAVQMGLLGHESQLNKSDIAHGHFRVFSYHEIRRLFEENGFTVRVHGGYWLKTLANAQIETWYSTDIIDAYMALGERYPEIAAETYVIASR